MTYKPRKLFKNIKPKSPLDKFVEERAEYIEYISEGDKQTLIVEYIQCIRLDEIEEPDARSQRRSELIDKWAAPDKLTRLKYFVNKTGNNIISGFQEIPELEREYILSSDNQEKFRIIDGNHRINKAKELGMKCILARVIERVVVDKTDTKNFVLNKE